jgi:thiamine pyrophosphokinase
VFANGDVNDGPMVQRALVAARRWDGPLIVAADGGARVAQYYDLSVDTIIGDLDSLSAMEVQGFLARGVNIQRYSPEKDETDLELALRWAAGQGARWIRVVGGLGNRLDQTLANVYLLALPELGGCDVRLVAGKQEAWLLRPGEHDIEGAKGDTVSLIPLGGTVHDVRTENLYYPLRDETLLFGPARGISNVMNGDMARVGVGQGLLLVVHTVGRA